MRRAQTFTLLAFFLLTGFVAWAGCERAASQSAAAPDSEIQAAVQNELAMDPLVPSGQIQVATERGVVQLTGAVSNLLAKERASALAGSVLGVRSVVNRIVVSGPSRTDPEIRTDVQAALLADAAADAYQIGVEVQNSNVHLSGTVDSHQERVLAERLAMGVRGVKAVENDIRIRAAATRNDTEIRNDVVSALRWDKLVDDAAITVTAEQGTVTLSGIVGSVAELRRAIADAWVAGVHAVNASELRVEPWADEDRLRGDKFKPEPDPVVRQAVIDALAMDPRVYSFNVDVTVDGGTATLRGTVDNLRARQAAEAAARNTVGVRTVKNELTVRSAENPSDATIAQRIRSALVRDPFVDRYQVMTRVEDGVVHLSGSVESKFEKAQAEDIASRMRGVKSVENEIEVTRDARLTYDPYVDWWDVHSHAWDTRRDALRPPSRTDEEILGAIQYELRWSPHVDAEQVHVEVERGVATLSGTVDSEPERWTAVVNAYEGGAVNVVDSLTVQ